MTVFTATLREANDNGTLIVTIPKEVAEKHGLHKGDRGLFDLKERLD